MLLYPSSPLFFFSSFFFFPPFFIFSLLFFPFLPPFPLFAWLFSIVLLGFLLVCLYLYMYARVYLATLFLYGNNNQIHVCWPMTELSMYRN